MDGKVALGDRPTTRRILISANRVASLVALGDPTRSVARNSLVAAGGRGSFGEYLQLLLITIVTDLGSQRNPQLILKGTRSAAEDVFHSAIAEVSGHLQPLYLIGAFCV